MVSPYVIEIIFEGTGQKPLSYKFNNAEERKIMYDLIRSKLFGCEVEPEYLLTNSAVSVKYNDDTEQWVPITHYKEEALEDIIKILNQ